MSFSFELWPAALSFVFKDLSAVESHLRAPIKRHGVSSISIARRAVCLALHDQNFFTEGFLRSYQASLRTCPGRSFSDYVGLVVRRLFGQEHLNVVRSSSGLATVTTVPEDPGEDPISCVVPHLPCAPAQSAERLQEVVNTWDSNSPYSQTHILLFHGCCVRGGYQVVSPIESTGSHDLGPDAHYLTPSPFVALNYATYNSMGVTGGRPMVMIWAVCLKKLQSLITLPVVAPASFQDHVNAACPPGVTVRRVDMDTYIHLNPHFCFQHFCRRMRCLPRSYPRNSRPIRCGPLDCWFFKITTPPFPSNFATQYAIPPDILLNTLEMHRVAVLEMDAVELNDAVETYRPLGCNLPGWQSLCVERDKNVFSKVFSEAELADLVASLE